MGENMNIPAVKLPTFSMTLPVSGDVIEYRPFVVKEEKLLILANESDDIENIIRAISDTIRSCTFEKMSLEKYCLADAQYAFLQVRGKSIGNIITLYAICGECGHKHLAEIEVNDFEVRKNDNYNSTVTLDGVKVELKYPTLQHYVKLYSSTEENDFSGVYDMIAECVVKIYNEDEVYVNTPETYHETREYIDNLNMENFKKLEEFFVNMPVLYKKLDFNCNQCEKENTLLVDGIRSFFG